MTGPPVYFLWKHDLPYLWDSPFSAPGKLSGVQTIRLGWNIHSPHLAALLKEHSIASIHRAMFDRPDVFLLCGNADAERLIEFIREHLGEKVRSTVPRYYLYEHDADCGPRMLLTRQLRRSGDDPAWQREKEPVQ